MRKIAGELYSVDEDLLYNRYDEIVGFIEKGEIVFTSGWNTETGSWDYEE